MWKVSIYMGSDRLPALGSGARGEKKTKKKTKNKELTVRAVSYHVKIREVHEL